MNRSLATLLLALTLGACSPTLFSVTSHRGHTALDREALQELATLTDRGSVTRASLLVTLGPPVTVLGQDDGEIFVYRRIARDTSVLYLNPGYLVFWIPPIPLWSDAEVSGRDDVLMVFFDDQGQMRGLAFRNRVGATEHSRSARLGDRIRAWID